MDTLTSLPPKDERFLSTPRVSGSWVRHRSRSTSARRSTRGNRLLASGPREADAWTGAPQLRAIVVRPGILYGSSRGIVGDLLKDAANSLVRVVGNGENHWPLIYDRDLGELARADRQIPPPHPASIMPTMRGTRRQRNGRGARRPRAHAAERPPRAPARSAEENGRRSPTRWRWISGSAARAPALSAGHRASFGRRKRRAPVRGVAARQSRLGIWKFGNVGIWNSEAEMKRYALALAFVVAASPAFAQTHSHSVADHDAVTTALSQASSRRRRPRPRPRDRATRTCRRRATTIRPRPSSWPRRSNRRRARASGSISRAATGPRSSRSSCIPIGATRPRS